MSSLNNLKANTDSLPANQAGVYEIPFQLFNNELQCYKGIAKRKFSDRLKKHKRVIRHGKLRTALSILYCNVYLK